MYNEYRLGLEPNKNIKSFETIYGGLTHIELLYVLFINCESGTREREIKRETVHLYNHRSNLKKNYP